MAHVPTSVRRQGHTDIRQTDAGQLVAVRIDCGHQVGIGLTNLGRKERSNPLIHPWPKVEPGDGPQMRRELYSCQRLEGGGRVCWGHHRALIEARMEAWRRGLSLSHPTVEIHQGRAQQGSVV